MQLEKLKAPHGYTINRTSENIFVNAGETSTVTLTNDVVLGQVTIYKQDSETGMTPQGDCPVPKWQGKNASFYLDMYVSLL